MHTYKDLQLSWQLEAMQALLTSQSAGVIAQLHMNVTSCSLHKLFLQTCHAVQTNLLVVRQPL